MSRSARVARNVSWSLAGQVGIAAANLVLIPRLVRGFGIEDYGLYVLMYAASNYVQLFTFGAGSSTVRYVAERRAAGDGRGVRDALRYGAILHMGGAAFGALLLWLAAPRMTAFFQVPPGLFAPGVAILRAAAVGAVFAAGVQWTQVALQGFQRFDWQSFFVLVQGILMPLGVAVLLFCGKGLRAAGMWYVAVSALSFFASAAVLRWIVRAEPACEGREGLSFREFVVCGLGLWPGPMAWIVANQLDKAFIARSLALSSLTLYAVPSGLLQRLQIIPGSVSTVLVPVVSEVRGDGAAEDLRCMYVRATRLLTGLLAPVYLLIFALMPQFLSLWLGGRFGTEGVWPARFLVLAQGVGLLAYTPNSMAVGRGRGWWLSAVAWGQAAVSLALWPLLIPRFGILGSALGSLCAQIVPVAFYLKRLNGLLGLSWRRYFEEALGPAALAGAALAVVVFPLHHLIGGWLSLIGLSAAGLSVYAVVLWSRLPLLDRDLIRRWRL